jgi:CPA2 family monovalent cation:H+ antiporter-2
VGVPVFEIGAVVLLAALLGGLARLVGQPSILGFVLAGLILSPFTLGLRIDHHQVEVLADLGVVFLLFEAGIEIDFIHLVRSRLAAYVPLQVGVTAGLVGGAGFLLGLGTGGSLLLGLAVALSSGVVVRSILSSEQRTTNAATESALLAWSQLQDVFGALVALLALVLLGYEGRPGPLVLGRDLLYVLVVVAVAGVLPRLLRTVHAQHDLYLLIALGTAVGLAGLGAAYLSVPLPLSAFLAGLAIGATRQAHEVRERLSPFRVLFAVMFFVAMGSLSTRPVWFVPCPGSGSPSAPLPPRWG